MFLVISAAVAAAVVVLLVAVGRRRGDRRSHGESPLNLDARAGAEGNRLRNNFGGPGN
jgi:hypothetical protein